MTVSVELNNRVHKIISDCVHKLLPYSGIKISVLYRKDMGRAAGYAYTVRNHIDLSEQLLLNNVEDFCLSTVPHEVSHIITSILYPNAKRSHGPEFKSVMLSLGFDPTTYHSYDVSSLLKGEQFNYTCVCDNVAYSLSKLIHGKISAGQNRICKSCRTTVIYNPKGNSNV
jgi:SprT protein